MKLAYIVCLCFCVLLSCQQDANSYSLAVHRNITEKVIDQNSNAINGYLNNVGITKGITEFINNKEVRKWIEDGSYEEDSNWSFVWELLYSHFYNPITNTSGVGGVFPSAYDWANDPTNEWSWAKARDNFYKGLTLVDKTEREKALGNSFKAIGHVMHLIQDVSVPAHTRADLHALVPLNVILGVGADNFETYTNTFKDNLNYTGATFPYWNESTVTGAPKQLWDMESYNGQTIYGSDRIGLAEYSNANFFSDGTIFDDFTFPAWTSVIEYEDNDATGKVRTYLKKIGDGEIINHLAAGKWYYKYLSPSFKRFGLKLDDMVCADYANKLLPRAVGYSAGLLNYFFRGQIDMIPDEVTGSGYVIVNNTEEVLDGTFELYYDKADPVDERAKIILSNGSFILGTKSSGNNKSPNITFTPPTLAEAKEPGKYILVYRGRLGNETDAVAAKLISGAFYVAGQTSDNRWFVKKLTLNGDPVWVKYLDDGSAWSVTADDSGVYVGGKTNLADYGHWRVEKRSLQTGEIIWSNSINSWASVVRRLRLHNGFLYAVGNDADNNGRLRKLNINDGSVVWDTTVNEGSVGAQDCFVNDSGVYIVGGLYRDASYTDGSSYAIQKRDLASGALLDFWSYPDYSDWILHRCAGDDSGLYISGRQTNSNYDFLWSIEKRSFNNLGTVLWTQTVSPAFNAQSGDMAVDKSGVYTTGAPVWSPSRLEKRDLSSGALLWERVDSSWNPFGVCTYPGGVAYTYTIYNSVYNGHVAAKTSDGVDKWDVTNEPSNSWPYAIIFNNK